MVYVWVGGVREVFLEDRQDFWIKKVVDFSEEMGRGLVQGRGRQELCGVIKRVSRLLVIKVIEVNFYVMGIFFFSLRLYIFSNGEFSVVKMFLVLQVLFSFFVYFFYWF